jgi:hypothetical protein
MVDYPVPGRSPLRNRRIAAHEIGHTFVARCLGDYVHAVTIVPDQGPNGFEGRCVRSGPVNQLTLSENMESKTVDIVDICARLERLAPEIGTPRLESSEYISHCHDNIIELLAAEEPRKRNSFFTLTFHRSVFNLISLRLTRLRGSLSPHSLRSRHCLNIARPKSKLIAISLRR